VISVTEVKDAPRFYRQPYKDPRAGPQIWSLKWHLSPTARLIEAPAYSSQQAPPPAAAGQFLLASIWRAGQARGEAQDGECHGSMAKEDIRAQEGHRKGDGENLAPREGSDSFVAPA
jgi:hypothetical protein